MSGWYKNGNIDKAIDDIESILNSLCKSDKEQTWNWISFHHEIEDNLNTGSGLHYDDIEDETIKWMLNRPEKFKRHMEIYERSIIVSKERVVNAEKHVERMRKFEQEYKQET